MTPSKNPENFLQSLFVSGLSGKYGPVNTAIGVPVALYHYVILSLWYRAAGRRFEQGGQNERKGHEYFFPETLVSAKNGTYFTVILSFIKIMTHVG